MIFQFFWNLAMKRVFIVTALVIFAPCFVSQARELQQGNRGISNKYLHFYPQCSYLYDELCLITHLVSKR